MQNSKNILDILATITQITNNPKLSFEEKLQRIITGIVKSMNTEKGSIMILKGRKNMEVVASTNTDIIGMKQLVDSDSPSSWVVKNKRLLYIDKLSNTSFGSKKIDYYKKDAFMLAPILINDKVIGVISLTDKIGEDIFTNKEQGVMLNIAGYLISSLENYRLTETIKKSKNDLRKKNLKLKKLEKLKSELFNMLIHDLKGPISEIVANLDILTYTVTDSENLDYVKTAQTGCDTLFRMVSDLLDITRLEEGSMKLFYEDIEPFEFIREAISRLYSLSEIKKVKLVEKTPDIKEKMIIQGDKGCLLRVMQNLISNALRYSLRKDIIEIGFDCNKSDMIRFFVTDNGPGVLPEHKDKIFDKFVQLEKNRDGRKYTTGLGLTFCKMAVEAHKGNIDVDSDGKKRSCFYFHLPLKQG